MYYDSSCFGGVSLGAKAAYERMYTRSLSQTLNRCRSVTSPVGAGPFRSGCAPVAPAPQVTLPPKDSVGTPFLPWGTVTSRARVLRKCTARTTHLAEMPKRKLCF